MIPTGLKIRTAVQGQAAAKPMDRLSAIVRERYREAVAGGEDTCKVSESGRYEAVLYLHPLKSARRAARKRRPAEAPGEAGQRLIHVSSAGT